MARPRAAEARRVAALDAQTEKKDRARIDKIEQRKQTRDVALKQRRLQVPRLPSDSSEQEGNESGGDSGGDGDLNGNDQERGAMRQAHVLEQRTYADADGDGVITTTVKALGSRGVAEPIPVLTSDSSEESVTTLPQRAKGAHTRGTAQGEDNAVASEIQASVATEKSKHETGHARGPEKRSRPNSRNRFRSLSKHKTKGKGKATLSKGAGRPRTNAVRKSSGRR
ncbi:hypothetical protein FVE85_8893 [Porphyridium purpureum]|uniref:Uncharacterized protein n=1 Tax=Porphyridium purpureum TaxID=35688 RepID=A0A5J4YQ57_PORPP|nr:hypothetical protein FVE85_8893 [Porphyridium purpureum]|eukprot:POR3701..scf296_7